MAARKGNVTKSPVDDPRKITFTAERKLLVAFKHLCDQDDRDQGDALREMMIIAVTKGHLDVYERNA